MTDELLHRLLTARDVARRNNTEASERNKQLVAAGKLQIYCHDASHTSFAANSFDAVVTINTVYFWQQPAVQIAELKRILRPDAVLLIGFRPRSEMQPLSFTQEVFQLYEPEDVIQLLESNGFRKLKHEARPVSFKSPEGLEFSFIDNCILFKNHK